MKKWIPAMLCLALLAFLLQIAVIAEPGDDPTETTTTATEDTAATTDTNATSTTTSATNNNANVAFSFTYGANHESITVTWNAKENEGLKVTAVKLDSSPVSKTIGNINDSTGKFEVDLSDVYPGLYKLTYVLSKGQPVVSSTKVERSGELSTVLSVTVVNQKIQATLKDNYGRPVADYPVRLFIDGTEQLGEKTDENGRVTFSTIAPSDSSDIACIADNNTIGTISYTGCQKSYSPNGETTQGTQKNEPTATNTPTKSTTAKKTTTTTKSKATAATTAPTYAIVNGDGTTAVVGGSNIAVNVSFDTQVAKNFNYSNTDFEARSRLILTKDVYSSLVGDSTSTLMLLAKTSQIDVTDQFISQAINGKTAYSLFDAQDTLRIPLDLSLTFVDASHDVNTEISMPASEVTVEFPIPQSMKDTKKYKIVAAVYDDNGIKQLIDATTSDGTIQFKTDQLTHIAILGFASPVDLDKNGAGLPTIPLAMITVGILLLGGAITLLYFFFLRRPLPAAEAGSIDETMELDKLGLPDKNPVSGPEEPSEEFPPDNERDIYSGAPKKPAKTSPETAKPSSPGVSLGSLANPQQETGKKKQPSDYDVDL